MIMRSSKYAERRIPLRRAQRKRGRSIFVNTSGDKRETERQGPELVDPALPLEL